jgi:hypothetical protein
MWLGVERADVIVNRDGGPVFGKDALTERLALHELHGFNAAQPASGKAEAADAAEGVNHAERLHQIKPGSAAQALKVAQAPAHAIRHSATL